MGGRGGSQFESIKLCVVRARKSGGGGRREVEGEEGFKANIKSKTSFLVVGILDILERRLHVRTRL